MLRPKLEIQARFDLRAEWNQLLTSALVESELFEVVPTDDFPRTPPTRRFRKNLSFLRLQDVLIAVDTWDNATPSSLGHPLFDDVDLLLKIEYSPDPLWEKVARRHQLRVRPWTMFGYPAFPVGAFQWSPSGHRHLCSFSGDQKRGRRAWLDAMLELGVPVCGVQSPQDYIPLLQETCWGVITQGRKGRCCDGKNRREHAFTSVGMPLALNYQPTYPFPMRPGIEYVFLRSPDDLQRLREIDPAPFAAASQRLWRDYFSPKGAARTLIKLVDEMGDGGGAVETLHGQQQ